MMREVLKSKIHRATITKADLHYEGSLSVDRNLLDAADILPYEAVNIWNVNNGERLQTYALPAPAGSGVICLNGAAARKGQPGDLIIIATFTWLDDAAARIWEPRVVSVNSANAVTAA
jgi:aspartate 1-decarboxylase